MPDNQIENIFQAFRKSLIFWNNSSHKFFWAIFQGVVLKVKCIDALGNCSPITYDFLFLQIVLAAAVSSASQNDDRFPSGARGGPPQPIVQRRTFDTSGSDSWSFFTIGSSNLRDKRKLPGTSNLPGQTGKETISDFSCRGRPPGYYADIKLGCEVSFNWDNSHFLPHCLKITKNVSFELQFWHFLSYRNWPI